MVPFTPFQEALVISKRLLETHLTQSVSDDDGNAAVLSEFIINLQTGLLPAQFVHHADLNEFWQKYVRPKTALTAFVLRFMTEFRFNTGYTDEQWKVFIEVLSSACSYAGANSALDPTLRDRAADAKSIQLLFQDNPWAVALIVISLTQRPNRIKRGTVTGQ